MSQRIPLKALSETTQSNLQTKLTFYAKEKKNWNKKDRYSKASLTGKVTAYRVFGDNLAIPYTTAFEITGKVNNDRVYKRGAFKRILEPREDQRDIVKKVVEMLKYNGRCLLCARPGAGKTVMSLIVSSLFKYYTCVLVQNCTLIPQWTAEARKFTDAKIWCVGDQEMPEEFDIMISYIGRVDKIPEEIKDKIGFLIIDEGPLHCNQPGINAILSFQPRHILVCTATPSRSRDGKFVIMEAVIGKDNILNVKVKLDYTVLCIKTNFDSVMEEGPSGRLNWTAYIQGLLYNDERNELIAELAVDYLDEGRKVMIITTEKNHVMILHKILTDAGINAEWLCGKKKSYNMCDILIGNMQKCGVGFDESNYCQGFNPIIHQRIDTVIIASEIRNEENIEQAAGRGFRGKNPLIIHLKDKTSLSESNWKLARKTHIDCGATIKYAK